MTDSLRGRTWPKADDRYPRGLCVVPGNERATARLELGMDVVDALDDENEYGVPDDVRVHVICSRSMRAVFIAAGIGAA